MSHELKEVDVGPQLGPPLPSTFRQYLRSMGPGIIVVLTWLGAGDIVECGISGGNYGYALMWIIAVALIMRYLFVSLIAKYQLCNQHGEGVLDGLARLHPWYAPFLMVVAIVMGHIYGSYMSVGIGESCVAIAGFGATWQWATLWCLVALAIVFWPVYGYLEIVFKVMLALLAVSLIGLAAWVGPSPSGILEGVFEFKLPEQKGEFDSLLIAIGMLGAIGGSLMNLAYPYFLDQKGWKGPRYRRLQMYDFLLAVIVMIVLDLAIWTVGAELIFGTGAHIETLEDLSTLLSKVLGSGGRLLFHLGVFAAVFTSLVGHAVGLGMIASHGYLRWQAGSGPLQGDYRTHPLYRAVVVWILVSPLVWTMPGMPNFVQLTLITNSLQVVLIPILAGGLWMITARRRFIGEKYRNRWWENGIMGLVFFLALFATVGSVKSVFEAVQSLLERT
ncbi:manganese transport protein MntH [Symmachiella dynata]|uniref:Nramp family divalent metal transporter n=1 Tax=Symmachiella dynata TaxID=2527995 RepID=UPI001188E5C4|nr:Nramp family divalent metal transporter [Symmachiella dynata]QDT50485.1 manganese transport protein MntH [Symmachiella dynata]